jgi:hypothetical protein
VFSNQDNNVEIAPLLIGYRYTLDKTGTVFYLEPNEGYTFGGSSLQKYSDGNYNYVEKKVWGPSVGLGFGYLFQPGRKIQFNLGLRWSIFLPTLVKT